MTEQRKKFGIEMLPSLRQRLHAHAVSHGMKLYEATQEAVEAYLGEKRERPEDRVPSDLQPIMRMLAEILVSGDDVIAPAAVASVKAYRERMIPRAASSVRKGR